MTPAGNGSFDGSLLPCCGPAAGAARVAPGWSSGLSQAGHDPAALADLAGCQRPDQAAPEDLAEQALTGTGVPPETVPTWRAATREISLSGLPNSGAMACVAATILICAVAAALVQLAAELLSFPAPIAVTAMTLMAAALLGSLRRHLRTAARHRSGPGNPHSLQR